MVPMSSREEDSIDSQVVSALAKVVQQVYAARVLFTEAVSEDGPPNGLIISTQGCSEWKSRSLIVEDEMGVQMDLEWATRDEID